MLAPLVCLTLLAATSSESVQLASPGFNVVNLEAKVGDFFADYFAQQLALEPGIRVTTKSEISALLGFERQKQLLGCASEQSSCLAELAGALGVDGLITGSIAKFGNGYVVNIKIVGATDARPLAVLSAKVKGEDAMVDWLANAAKEGAAQLLTKLKRKPAPTPSKEQVAAVPPPKAAQLPPPPAPLEQTSSAPHKLRPAVIVPAAVGGALLVGGVVIFGIGKAQERTISSGEPTFNSAGELHAAVLEARNREQLGTVLIGVGVAGIATAAGLYFWGGGSSKPAVSVLVSPSGIAVAGELP